MPSSSKYNTDFLFMEIRNTLEYRVLSVNNIQYMINSMLDLYSHLAYKTFQIQNCSSKTSCKKAGKVSHFTDWGGAGAYNFRAIKRLGLMSYDK